MNDLALYGSPGNAEFLEETMEELIAAKKKKKKRQKKEKDTPRWMTHEEVEDCAQYVALRADTSLKYRFYEQVFLLACGPALRNLEIVNLRLADVRLTLPKPHVWVEKGSGGYSASTPLVWAWGVARMGVFLKWRQEEYGHSEPSDHWYLRPKLGGPAGKHGISYAWKQCLHPLPIERQKQLYPHCGRHTAATHLLEAGHTLPTVSKFLRHRCLQSTLPYLHPGEVLTGDLYGEGPKSMDPQLKKAWEGPRGVEKTRLELEDLAMQTPDGSRVDKIIIEEMKKDWRRKRLYGRRMDQMIECYRVLSMPPRLYGDYFEDCAWREVVIWRWISWEYYRKELDFHYGQERSPEVVAEDTDRPPAERSADVVHTPRV
jgi:site-specific recombinase XerD